MALALLFCKDEHSPEDLRRLAQAPYFDANLVRRRSLVRRDFKSRRRWTLPDLSVEKVLDEELAPPGAPICSHGIAPSTRLRFERLTDIQLPLVNPEAPQGLMRARQLRRLLSRHAELRSDPTVRDLYQLLNTAAQLRFRVGWLKELREESPRGWR